jgi:hypothetical protein
VAGAAQDHDLVARPERVGRNRRTHRHLHRDGQGQPVSADARIERGQQS